MIAIKATIKATIKAIALSLALIASAFAQSQTTATPVAKNLPDLDANITQALAKSKVTGASVIIIENGVPVMHKNFGMADIGKQKKVDGQTIFRAGSISKSIIGLALMMLVEEGKLDLTSKLADIAPEIKFTNPWESTHPLRIEHLIEHTTGFESLSFRQMRIAKADASLRDAIELYGPYVSRWKPGSYFAYCDSAPIIAAYIIEKISGQTWAEFTQQRIFLPLGIGSAHWDKSSVFADRLAKSYRDDGKTSEAYVDIPGKPSGALNITPEDLSKLMQLFINRGSSNGVRLLTPASIDRIETPHSSLAARAGLKAGYGLGMVSTITEKSVFHGNNGSIDGFLASFHYEPTHRAGYVIMINSMAPEALEVSTQITAYLERDWLKPQITTSFTPKASELNNLSGFYNSIAPITQWLAPLEQPIPTSISIEQGQLTFNDVKRIAIAQGLFQRPDRALANVVFVDIPEGKLMLTGTENYRRISTMEVIAKASYAGLWIFSLLSTFVLFCVWIIALIRRHKKQFVLNRANVLARLVPIVAVLLPVTFFILLVSGLPDPINQFGTASNLALALLVISILVPIAACASLIVVWRYSSQIRYAVRLFAYVNTFLAVSVSILFWQYGWLGLQTWR